MSKELLTEVDLTGLNRFNSQLLGALIGTGQGFEGDAQRFIKTEAGQLAWDISRTIGPKTKAGGAKKIDADARKVFFTVTVPVFTGDQAGHGETQWLFGSSKRNYLVGADREDIHLRLGVAGMKEISKRASRTRGPRWKDASRASRKSGQQRTILINRVIVSSAALATFIKEQAKKVGLLRASFAYAAGQLVPSKPIPAWVANHFGSKAQGRAIFDPSQMNHETLPSIAFGSTAKGVNSNPYIVDKIARAVEKRKYILKSKLNKIVKGYVYNWNTGQVFKPVVPKGGLDD